MSTANPTAATSRYEITPPPIVVASAARRHTRYGTRRRRRSAFGPIFMLIQIVMGGIAGLCCGFVVLWCLDAQNPIVQAVSRVVH